MILFYFFAKIVNVFEFREFLSLICRMLRENHLFFHRIVEKKIKKNKQNNFFMFNNDVCVAIVAFIVIFTQIFMFVHFDFKNKIRIKTNVFDFVIVAILCQLILR